MENSSKSKKNSNWLWWYVLAVLLLAGGINAAMYLPIPTLKGLGAEDWLGFWGGYLGGVLGCIPAFAALIESRRQAKQQHEEVQEQLSESKRQAGQMHFETIESRRCSLMPVVDLTITSLQKYPTSNEHPQYWGYIREGSDDCLDVFPEYFTKEYYDEKRSCLFDFYIRNIGPGPALNTTITLADPLDRPCDIFTGDVSTSLDVHLIFETQPLIYGILHKTLHFKIQYHDVFGNVYEREHSITLDPEGILSADWTSPTLKKRITSSTG